MPPQTHNPNLSTGDPSPPPPAKAATPVAHLIGPGVLRVRNRMPCWQPIEGGALILHPESLRTLIVHGLADLTGAALRLLWRHGVHVSFLNRRGGRILGSVNPPAEHAPSLACWQHWAVRDTQFVLQQARTLVMLKIESIQQVADGLFRRGHDSMGPLRQSLAADLNQVRRANSLASLLGHEGAASARWYAALQRLFPATLPYPGRSYHPPSDPVNAMLSLGYTLLLTRMQCELAAAGLDPLVGVYHQPRAGKPALACDLIEPFRVPVVDHLVLAQTRQGCFQAKHFTQSSEGVRLRPEDFRRFVQAFEQWYVSTPKPCPFQTQTRQTIARFAGAVRHWAQQNRLPDAPAQKSKSPEHSP